MMDTSKHADPYCMSCRGVGSTIENEKVDENGDYWWMFVDCHCVTARAAVPTDGGNV